MVTEGDTLIGVSIRKPWAIGFPKAKAQEPIGWQHFPTVGGDGRSSQQSANPGWPVLGATYTLRHTRTRSDTQTQLQNLCGR